MHTFKSMRNFWSLGIIHSPVLTHLTWKQFAFRRKQNVYYNNIFRTIVAAVGDMFVKQNKQMSQTYRITIEWYYFKLHLCRRLFYMCEKHPHRECGYSIHVNCVGWQTLSLAVLELCSLLPWRWCWCSSIWALRIKIACWKSFIF